MTSEAKPRQLIILCDGTNNNITGNQSDTNVVNLFEMLPKNNSQQLVFYDAGVGNPGELPGATLTDSFKRLYERVQGLAFGTGIFENMAETYLFLMRNYRPGDELYFFGFSRGAFTARSVAGLVNRFGILKPQMESMIPTLLHIYFSDSRAKSRSEDIKKQAVRLFSREDNEHVDIHFVGVWDTVASVGMPPFSMKITAIPKLADKNFVHVRQALALDEHRTQFKPRLYAAENGKHTTKSGKEGDLEQVWFPGSHCDVGGGYMINDSRLSNQALRWLIVEAVKCGLLIDEKMCEKITFDAPRRVHSEPKTTWLWALTGLSVRDSNTWRSDEVERKGKDTPLKPVQFEPLVVEAKETTFPKHSVWQRAKTPTSVWLSMVIFLLLATDIGSLLAGQFTTPYSIFSVLKELQHVTAAWSANGSLQAWQLLGLCSNCTLAFSAKAVYWALFWDLFLIGSYAFFLSWFVSKSFDQLAGYRQAGDRERPWLNWFGFALPSMVISDLVENVFTALTLMLSSSSFSEFVGLCQLGMAGSSILKWFYFLCVLALITWAALNKLSERWKPDLKI